jgi:hypothetical protein
MPLTRTYFLVGLDDPDNPGGELLELRVEVKGADQLRAELEGRKMGIDHRVAIHQTYLWAWAAMVREGHYTGPFKDFRDVVVKVSPDEDAADEETVDPTRPAAIAGLPSS